MNATGSVDNIRACTHPYAHFSRAQLARNDCTCGSRLSSVARFLKQCHLSIMSLLGVLLLVFLWLLLLLLVLCHDPQPRQLFWLEPEVSLRLCSMEWNVWLYCQSDSRHKSHAPSVTQVQHGAERTRHQFVRASTDKCVCVRSCSGFLQFSTSSWPTSRGACCVQ